MIQLRNMGTPGVANATSISKLWSKVTRTTSNKKSHLRTKEKRKRSSTKSIWVTVNHNKSSKARMKTSASCSTPTSSNPPRMPKLNRWRTSIFLRHSSTRRENKTSSLVATPSKNQTSLSVSTTPNSKWKASIPTSPSSKSSASRSASI